MSKTINNCVEIDSIWYELDIFIDASRVDVQTNEEFGYQPRFLYALMSNTPH